MKYDSELSLYQGGKKPISVMRGRPLLPIRTYQNLGASFGAPQTRFSNCQSTMVIINVSLKQPFQVPLFPRRSCGSPCHSSAQNPAFLTHTRKPTTLRFGHFPREQNRAGCESGFITEPIALLHLSGAIPTLVTCLISSLHQGHLAQCFQLSLQEKAISKPRQNYGFLVASIILSPLQNFMKCEIN